MNTYLRSPQPVGFESGNRCYGKSQNQAYVKTTIPREIGHEEGEERCVTAFQENQLYGCESCSANLEKVTELKKQNILLELSNAKLQQQINNLEKQNDNLTQNLRKKIETTLDQQCNSNKYLCIKQDLQSQLFQSRLITQLLILGQQQSNPEIEKMEDLLLERLKMREQIQQMDRIIRDRVLYPVYGQVGRVKGLRDAVEAFRGVLLKECRRAHQEIRKLRTQLDQTKKQMKSDIRKIVKHCALMIETENQNSKPNNQIEQTKPQNNPKLAEQHKKQQTPIPEQIPTNKSQTKTGIKSKNKRALIKTGKEGEKQSVRRQTRIIRQCCV